MAHLQRPHSHLELTPDELRRLGYAIVDEMVQHYETLSDQPVTHRASRDELERKLREPVPTRPESPDKVLSQAVNDVFGNVMYTEHPRFFAFVPSPSNAVSALADMLVAGYNAFAGTWLEASGAAMVEVVVLDWLRDLLGLPETSGGVFTSGGSMANLTALHAARFHHFQGANPDGIIYYSNQTHASVDRALRVLGFNEDQMRRMPADGHFRLDLAVLKRTIAEDRANGCHPFCVVANAGATNTGAIDPLPEIADLCAAEGLWMHVDAAYGGAAILSERGKLLLHGIEQADSITIDPHKWLFQPYEMGCLLVRQRESLREAFRYLPEYLKDTHAEDQEVNFYDYGVQLTRGFRALKLWMSLKVFGLDAFRDAVDWGIAQAEIAADLLTDLPQWQIVTPPQIGVINFRYDPQSGTNPETLDTLNRQIVKQIVESGYAMIATTELRGQTVIRLCMINPRTTEDDIRGSIDRLTAIGDQLYVR